MKTIGIWSGIILAIMIGIPTVIIVGGGFYEPTIVESIKNQATKHSQSPSIEDYREEEVIQVLAATMSPSTPKEALKAQAVISRTYLLRRELGIVEEGQLDKISKEEMKSLWQGEFDKYYKIFQEAALETKGEVMVYKDEVIEPVYHVASAGYTRDGSSFYKIDIPYLKAVESAYDQISNQKVVLTTQFVELLKANNKSLVLDPVHIENQVQIISRDTSGYIESLQIGNLIIEAETLKDYLGLQSTAFELKIEGDAMLFTSKGIGHGVGLSQNGALEMAKEGKDYKAILMHYYSGIEIRKK